MHRYGLLACLCLAACGTTTDDRPLTIEYVTETILAPTCGAAQCHSSFTQARGDIFDNVESARRSLVDNGLIVFESRKFDPADPSNADLIVWLTQVDPFSRGIGRMPYDAPMPNADIIFLKNFIARQAPGAQCDPELNGGLACRNKDIVACNSDWTFSETVIMSCGAADCIGGKCR